VDQFSFFCTVTVNHTWSAFSCYSNEVYRSIISNCRLMCRFNAQAGLTCKILKFVILVGSLDTHLKRAILKALCNSFQYCLFFCIFPFCIFSHFTFFPHLLFEQANSRERISPVWVRLVSAYGRKSYTSPNATLTMTVFQITTSYIFFLYIERKTIILQSGLWENIKDFLPIQFLVTFSEL
jgi:hypothetical protein